MKKRYSIKSLDTLPITAISFLTTERNETGEWRSQRPVTKAEKCRQCGWCSIFCPSGCIREREYFFSADLDYCKGCGVCASVCPARAIAIVREEA